jgi:hypothetical protein
MKSQNLKLSNQSDKKLPIWNLIKISADDLVSYLSMGIWWR